MRNALLFLVLAGSASCTPKDPDFRSTEGEARCEAYVACAEAVTPSAVPGINDLYGPEGLCWRSPEVPDEACEAACARGLSTLHARFPDELACPAPDEPDTDPGDTDTGDTDTGDSDTGDTDTGDPDTGDTDTGDPDTGDTDTGEPFVLEPGTWTLDQFETPFDSCGVPFGGFGQWPVEIVTSGSSEFLIDDSSLDPSLVYNCALFGTDFTCDTVVFGDFFFTTMSGTFGSGTFAKGTWRWEYPDGSVGFCFVDLPFTLQRL